MSRRVGDVIIALRRSAHLTQTELSARLGIAEAELTRYENGLRDPGNAMLEKLGDALGVTSDFLLAGFTLRGGIAVDWHMRRHNTAKTSDWKRVEARLNVLRMHSSYLLERVPLEPQHQVIHVDPDHHSPDTAAVMLRAHWKMPMGPIRHLTRWVEAAGVIVVEEDLGTKRIDGMSQWAGEHAVIMVNRGLPTDQKRLTLAHELGHLVLHGLDAGVEMERQAEQFAAEFLMPAHVINPEVKNLTVGTLSELKTQWGVTEQALLERASQLGALSAQQRVYLSGQMTTHAGNTAQPGNDLLASETPELAASVGKRLDAAGLARREIEHLIGVRPGIETLFDAPHTGLRAV